MELIGERAKQKQVEKLPKFRKKIYPKPEFGSLELENEFIIVGTSDNMKLYVGRLKK